MNQTVFSSMTSSYSKLLSESKTTGDDFKERKARIVYYQSFTKDKLLSMDEPTFVQYIGKLWASIMWNSKEALCKKIIESNGGFGSVKESLAELLYGKDKIDERWNRVIKNVSFIGPSYMSELLCYIYPNEYALSNRQVQTALSVLDEPLIPNHIYQYTGKIYLKVCDFVKTIQKELKKSGIECENLLAADYFLWEVAKMAPKQKEPKTSKGAMTAPVKVVGNKSFHKEIQTLIDEIGQRLGYETSMEVRIAKGAQIDNIWKISLGNMGHITYVFEVQDSGSIDSLILNLKRAFDIDRTVQAVVAVSDAAQLVEIKNNAETVKDLPIRTWDVNDVQKAHDSLMEAYSIINKIGLVDDINTMLK